MVKSKQRLTVCCLMLWCLIGTAMAQNDPQFVIKKDNTREAYDRAKIEKGIMLSVRKRSVPLDKITDMIDDIENTIFNMDTKEIPSSVIGELIMDRLQKLDQVAYVRFASVYREFQDVDTFMAELQKILTRNEK